MADLAPDDGIVQIMTMYTGGPRFRQQENNLRRGIARVLRTVQDIVKSLAYPPGSSESRYIDVSSAPRVTIPGLENYPGSTMLSEKKHLECDLSALASRLGLSHHDGRFPRFGKLPEPIREKIWDFAILQETNDRFVVMDVYQRRIMPTKNLVPKFMSVSKESKTQALKFYMVTLPVYLVDLKSYRRRPFPRSNLPLLRHVGVVYLQPRYDTFIYGPRYVDSKWVDNKPYCGCTSAMITINTPGHLFEIVEKKNLFGIVNIAPPRLKVRSMIGRRRPMNEPELDEGKPLFENAYEGFRINVARTASTSDILAVLDTHGIRGLGRFCKAPDVLTGQG